MEQFVFLGVLLSLIISTISPWIEKRFSLESSRVKIGIICLIALGVASVNYFAGEGFWSALIGVIGTATGYYAVMYKLVFTEDKLKKAIENML